MRAREFDQRIWFIVNFRSAWDLGIRFILSLLGSLLFGIFTPDWAPLFSPLLVILLFSPWLNFRKSDFQKLRLLYAAREAYRPGDIDAVIEYLTRAYEVSKDERILHLLGLVSDRSLLSEDGEIAVLKAELQRFSDPKLKEIIAENIEVLEYIKRHKRELEEISKKKKRLEQELSRAPSVYTKDLNNLIERYENLIRLEESKIAFYQELDKELKELKRAFLYKNKLLDEYQTINQLEQEYLTSSLKEEYEAQEREQFIDYQTVYLETLKKYAKEMNNVYSQQNFDELRKNFEEKKREMGKSQS